MYLIAGLGNPGTKYENTRHNAGFCTIDALADRYRIDVSEKKHKGLCGRGVAEGQKVILLKPLTFMNLSGESLRAAMDYYRLTPEEVLVIYDDVSLPYPTNHNGKSRARDLSAKVCLYIP